ncbi:MAG: TraM recognition domain-containing protein, partial [Conexivisphaerales archaeon]
VSIDDSFRKGHFWCFGTTRSGKALPMSAPVLTPTGFIRNEDLKVGDYVTTPDGGMAKIKGIYPQGEMDIYKITLRNGKCAYSTRDHLWPSVTKLFDHDVTIVATWQLMNAYKMINIYLPIYDPDTKKLTYSIIDNIEYSHKEHAQCILIDHPDHLYITYDYIVTHNTRLMESMIVQDIVKGNSVVIIDPKGDIELLRNVIMTAFMTGRHRDLVFISSVYPEFSARIDPLSYYYMPEELVGHIVSGVETGREPFFYNVAYEISLMVVLSLLASQKNTNSKGFSLLDVKNIISHSDLSKLKARIETQALMDKSLSQLNADLAKILESPQDYYSKVSSSLRVALTELTSGNIGKIVGATDSNRFLRKLEGDDPMARKDKNGNPVKSVIFIAQLGSLMTRKAAFTLGKVIISMIQSFTGRVFSSGKTVDPPLSVYIDEAQNVLYYGIEDLFAKSGGANVWIHGFSQSVNQMYAALGQDTAKSILDNTNTKVFMRVPDVDTAQYASEHFGKHKVLSPILSSTGGVSTRDEEEYVVDYLNFLNLSPRLFYMITYSGAFKGKTFDTYDVVSPFVQKFNIKFPDLHGKKAQA